MSQSPLHVNVNDMERCPDYPSASKHVTFTDSVKSLSPRPRSQKRSPKSLTRSKIPWIPAPGKTSKPTNYYWDDPSHRLEMRTSTPSPHRFSPIDKARSTSPCSRDHKLLTKHPSRSYSDEEKRDFEKERRFSREKQYQRKLNSLSNQVGSLKSQVELQRARKELEDHRLALANSHESLRIHEKILSDRAKELNVVTDENKFLRQSVEDLCNKSSITQAQLESMSAEHRALVNKLMETELAGYEASKQTTSLRHLVNKLRQEKFIKASDASHLAQEKDRLMVKLTEFENTNHLLQQMLADQRYREFTASRLADQRDSLISQLDHTEAKYQECKNRAIDQEEFIHDLKVQLTNQKEDVLRLTTFRENLETTKAHLQNQLKQKEADCNRMAVQIRNLESAVAQERIEVDHVSGLLKDTNQTLTKEKEDLKKAARAQKTRASRAESALERVQGQLLERESLLRTTKEESDDFRNRLETCRAERQELEASKVSWTKRVTELEEEMMTLKADKSRETEELLAQLQEKTSEVTTYRLEADRLRASLGQLETKLNSAEKEVHTMQGNIADYKRLVDNYRHDAELRNQAAAVSHMSPTSSTPQVATTSSKLVSADPEMKKRITSKIDDLKKLTENLMKTEQKLALSEERETELQTEISRLKRKLQLAEENGRHLPTSSAIHDDHIAMNATTIHHGDDHRRTSGPPDQSQIQQISSLKSQLDSLERKNANLESEHRSLSVRLNQLESQLTEKSVELERKKAEIDLLKNQLSTIGAEGARENQQIKERYELQVRTLETNRKELEGDLSAARAEISQLRRKMDEQMHELNSRISDLRDRLKQAYDTNRSFQSYVQFLKTSYSNVFASSSTNGIGGGSILDSGLGGGGGLPTSGLRHHSGGGGRHFSPPPAPLNLLGLHTTSPTYKSPTSGARGLGSPIRPSATTYQAGGYGGLGSSSINNGGSTSTPYSDNYHLSQYKRTTKTVDDIF